MPALCPGPSYPGVQTPPLSARRAQKFHRTQGVTLFLVPGKHASLGWDAQGSLPAVWLSVPTNIDSLSAATGILGKAKSNLYHLPNHQESRQEMLASTAGMKSSM